MTRTLRLLITADWPSRDASCEWALVDNAGKQLQRGRSEPRHWPEAEECEVFLSAEQCLLLRAALPKGAKSRLPEVISYALEDHLIGDAEADHFVAGASDSDGLTSVWVVARARLKILLATLSSVGRRPRRACCEIQLAPLRSGCWSVCLREQNASESGVGSIFGFARNGVEEGFAFDIGDPAAMNAPPLELRLALRAAQGSGRVPGVIEVYVYGITDEAARTCASSWQAALGIPVACAGEFIWHEHSGAASGARNLLTNEFAPPRRSQDGWGSFRPALTLALIGAVVFTLFSLGEWVWLSRQSGQLQQQMADTFRVAFPQSQALVNPPLQMQRLYDQLRRENGQLGATDFLPLLNAATGSMAGLGKMRRLDFDDGRLEVTLALTQAKTAERMQEILKGRDLSVTVSGTKPAKDGQEVETSFSLRSTR